MSVSATDYYIQFTQNGTITIPTNMTCDCLVVGAGGRGGAGAYSGGGGAGEVVYYPSLSLLSGVYNIEIGVDSATTTNRISKLRLGATEIIKANGGGNGGYWNGSQIETTERKFPSKLYTSLSTISSTTLNSISCFRIDLILNTTGITYGSGTYEVYYSTRYDATYNADKIFNNSASGDSGFANTHWVCIKLPIPIAMTSYSIYQRTGTTEQAQ